MKHKRAVTEADFRQPEYRNAFVDDYEFNSEGRPVRKDRWQSGMLQIAGAVGLSVRQGFEISQVVEAVEQLTKDANSWETEDFPECSGLIDIKLADGSMLIGVTYSHASTNATWQHITLNIASDSSLKVVAWRTTAPVAPDV